MARSNKRKRQWQASTNGHDEHANDLEQSSEDATPAAAAFDASPFVVEWVKEGAKPAKRAKLSKSKPRDISDEKEEEGIPDADLHGRYTVSPGSHWNNLRKYRNFVVNPNNEPKDDNKHKFELGQFVFVNHSEDIAATIEDDRDQWVAQVKEVRAEGQHAVYVRVLWMYWPEELPNGREVYHGERELVASNFHQIIDAMTVSGKAQVYHLNDIHDVSSIPGDALYWRQTLDVRKPVKSQVSTLPKECICKTISNPDGVEVRCPNQACEKWQHRECLTEAVLRRYWEERGSRLDSGHANGNTEAQDGEAKQDGNDDGDEIGDTIVASPKNGLMGLASDIGRNVFKRLTGASDKSRDTGFPNGTSAKYPNRSNKRGRGNSGAMDKDKPWEGILSAELQTIKNEEGLNEFNGKATIYRVVKSSGNKAKDKDKEREDFDEFEAACLFCGLSMVEGDAESESQEHDPNLDPSLFSAARANDPATTPKGGTEKKADYDAVREAAAENAASGDEFSATMGRGGTNGGVAKNDLEVD